ncbi:MAG: radical SAM protein [Anaerostipes sp.]|nr:radical SAM protein [Anaerostipes sp.]
MHYNGPIVRPQTDADSVFIEVTVGCTHNSCTFCNFYDGYPFHVAPIKQIEEDLFEVKNQYPKAKKFWANGGNPYALNTEKLEEIGKLFQKHFPDGRISTYARVDDLNRKSVEDMTRLKEAGFVDIVVGFETGDDKALEYVNKGYTSEDVLSGCKKLEEAGVDYRMIFLGGLSGRDNGEEAAKKTANVLNQLHPYIMYLNSVSILPGTKLYQDWETGIFKEAGEHENIMEFVTMLEHMKNEIMIFAAPNTTPFSFFVDLQPNKEELLRQMCQYAQRLDDGREEKIEKGRQKRDYV